MNPLYAAMNGNMPANGQNVAVQPPAQQMGSASSWPVNNLQNAIERAKQIASSMRNPQAFVNQYIPGVPANIANDPGQIMNWLQQTGRVSPQQIQMVNQLAGMIR